MFASMIEIILNQTLEDLFFITMPIFYLVGMVFLFGGVPMIIYFWKRKVPAAARKLSWAAWRKEPPLLLIHDSGRGEFTTIHERKGEGIVMTAEGKYKILPRYLPKGLQQIPKAASQATPTAPAENGEAAEGEDPVGNPTEPVAPTAPSGVEQLKSLASRYIFDFSDWIMKRTYLMGLGLPLFIGYTGKLNLMDPTTLALYHAGELMVKTEDGVLFNPNNLPDKKVEDALQPLMLLDGREINRIINEGYDQSQIAGLVQDAEERARLGQGLLSGKMKLLLGILVIGVIAAAALFLLPQLFGNKGQQQQPQETAQMILGLLGVW